MRSTELRKLGVNPFVITGSVQLGLIACTGRGIYALPSEQPALYPYAEVALRFPYAVISGPSAQWLAGEINQEPEEITLKVPRSKQPRNPTFVGNRRIRFKLVMDTKMQALPVEKQTICGVEVRIEKKMISNVEVAVHCPDRHLFEAVSYM